MLGPIQNEQATVIHSADQFLLRTSGLKLEQGKQCRTMDVVNLYPQVPRDHMMVNIIPKIRAHYSFAVASFIIELIKLVMMGSYVSYGGQIFESEEGIPTGLAP
eukprot:16251214-Heterocapsa_arctica.AAC.1